MPLQDYGRYMGNMAEAVQGPVNAFYQAQNNQRENARRDAVAQVPANRLAWDQQQAQEGAAQDDADDEQVAALAQQAIAAYGDGSEGAEDRALPFLLQISRFDGQTAGLLAQHLKSKKADPARTLVTQPGPFDSQIVTDGERFQVVQPQRAPAGGGGVAAVKPAKAPEGYRWSQDGESLEPIPGGPKDVSATQTLSPKDTNTARTKLTQVKVARQQLATARKRYEALRDTISAGPGGNLIPTPKGKAYDAAIDTMRSSITALTKVPGLGSMSDYETRLDQAKFPDRGKYEEAALQQLDALEQLLNTVEGGYSEMLGQSPAPAAAPTAPAAKAAPKPGENVRGYIFIGGDPKDKKNWVKDRSAK